MPTVLDSLIIEIGLDPTKFTKGQKEAIRQFNEAAEAAKKAASSIEASSSRSAEFLAKVNTQLMAFGALLVGSRLTGDLIRFGANVTKQDAATGRLAYTLETSVQGLDKWRNAAYLAGGSADGVTGFIQNLTSEFAKFEIHGQSDLIPYFRGLGVQVSDATGKMRPFADIMRDVSNAVKKLGPAQGAEWLRSIGADPGSINLLIKGGDELDRYLKMAERFSTVSPKNVENATKLDLAYRNLTIALTGLGRAALELLSTPLTGLFNSTANTAEELSRGEFISKGSLLDAIRGYSQGKGWNFRGFGPKSETATGAFSSQEEKEAFIRAEAAKRGINPDIAMGVAKSEGFNSYVGDKGTSFGAFQLHYKNNIPGLSNGGLGDVFTKQTGKHASDPSTEREQIQFALDEAKKSGWGAWHGWKGSQWAGIDRGGGSSTDIKINNININTAATDANGIAATIKPAIERSAQTYQGQGGVQ